ncbi:MAG TPA: type ISP restriction/modification enzyme, partial [Coriobacteriia bacterium]|nr:type ISP restriction/modification enzyme [Coriobacteriia bacterium]
VIDYVYGVLNSPVFRRSAREFLKSDFPIIPIPSSDETFSATVTFGARLRGLHLLEAPDIQPMSSFTVTFPEVGTNVVAERRYDGDRVWINKTQYFGCVSSEVWNYTIGGYQVTDKWLKDRKGTALSAAEVRHYQRTLTAIRKATDAVQSAPDSF